MHKARSSTTHKKKGLKSVVINMGLWEFDTKIQNNNSIEAHMARDRGVP